MAELYKRESGVYSQQREDHDSKPSKPGSRVCQTVEDFIEWVNSGGYNPIKKYQKKN